MTSGSMLSPRVGSCVDHDWFLPGVPNRSKVRERPETTSSVCQFSEFKVWGSDLAKA
jgi:hypothetical protein